MSKHTQVNMFLGRLKSVFVNKADPDQVALERAT